MIAAAIVGALLVALAGSAVADDRLSYVTRVLAAVRARGPAARATLERELYEAARTSCHGSPVAPDCLVAAAKTVCGGDATCELAADPVATNLRAAATWVDEATRARLVRESTNYRAALAGELHKRFAALAAELVASDGSDAAAIDRLCATRDRAVHACRPGDATCVPSLPWSRCVAALVWFVGGAR